MTGQAWLAPEEARRTTMAEKKWGPKYSRPGWIAVLGAGKYQHRFGGIGWTANGPLDDAYGPPALILTLDLTDPRLAEAKPKNKGCRELPLFSYVNGMVEAVQRYRVDHTSHTVRFFKAEPLSGTIESLAICPNPLPTRKLKLRRMKKSELPTSETAYWKACDTFCGGDGWLRIGGEPLWLYEPEKHTSSKGRPMKYVAAVGYDTNRNSPFLDEPGQLMFGEMALYFFVSSDLGEVVVSSQST
jgi:hypothetical protein